MVMSNQKGKLAYIYRTKMRLTFTEVFANTAYYYYLSRLATSLTYLQIYIFTDRYTD